METVTISTDVNNPTTMQYDGFLYCKTSSSGGSLTTIYINNTLVAFVAVVSNGNIPTSVRVQKGDTVYISGTGISGFSCNARFYTDRDYTDR